MLAMNLAAPASAQTGPVEAEDSAAPDRYNLHGQFTSVTQWHGPFNSPYQGPNSLQPHEPRMETVDLTLYLGLRLWKGAEFYVNPEIDQGFGLSSTLGMAGFSSGESYKLGNWTPYYKTQRAFLRQTLDLEGPTVEVEDGPNQLAGRRGEQSLTLTAGKFSIVDIFDTNPYAHDPKSDFLNWSIIDAGAFDYGGDAWGFTYGTAAEWTMKDWTLRGGFFALSTEPGSVKIDSSFAQNSVVLEAERRYQWQGQPGALKVLWFIDRGRMGRFDQATALSQATGAPASAAAVREFQSKTGYVLNLAQALGEHGGLFARWSQNDGKTESFDFTDINTSLSVGGTLDGTAWGRCNDRVGLAGVVNGLSSQAKAYFAAGGTGLLIGDGQLPNYGSEKIIEAYYSAQLAPHLSASLNFQRVQNPAYNRDRGPVSIYGVRIHADF